MKKIFLSLVICMSAFMLSGCEEKEKATISDLSFEFSESFSNCETGDTQHQCIYKNKNDFCIVNVFSGIPMTENDTQKTIKFLLFVDNNIEVKYGEKEINGNTWSTGYVENDGNEFQKMLYLINDYNGNRYEVSFDCSLNTNMSNEDLQAFENSRIFK
jgi:hypothetical protein